MRYPPVVSRLTSPTDHHPPGPPWYVLWSEARAEKKVAERLAAKGCEVWLPTATERRQWSDRWKTVTVPLFPGYLFASTDGSGYLGLLRTPGVLTLVKEAGRPAELSAAYVDELRRVIAHPELAVEAVQDAIPPGSEVLVREGPLAGFRGQVVESRGGRKLLVRIHGIGRAFLCTLGHASVTLVTETGAAA